MKIVYVVTDLNTGDIVSINESLCGARDALVDHLIENCGYTAEEWADFADNAGYNNVFDFQQSMRAYPDYDDMVDMRIDDYILGD